MTDNQLTIPAHDDSLTIPASQQMAIDVERGLREQQVGIYFVMPRVVRRVLQNELDITSPWQPPPHRKCCVVPRDRLLWVVARDELGVEPTAKLPDQIILIAQPEEDQLVSMTKPELQRHYWRLIFHARIDFLMSLRTRSDQMTIAELRHRIDLLGQSSFDEIRSVLRAEQMLVRPDDDRNVYAEFVAVYYELSAFAPKLLPIYFPSLPPSNEVFAVISADCDIGDLFDSTRPAELEAEEAINSMGLLSTTTTEPAVTLPVRKPSPRLHARLTRRADRLTANGNNVRAALDLQLAVEVAPLEAVNSARLRLEAEILKLVNRLQAALELSDQAAHPWLMMIEKLLPSARRGFWTANARLLYDLQNVCFDHEHEIYKVRLLRWATSLGKVPLKQPLSNQRLVLMSKHLRAASLKVPNVEIDSAGRTELDKLLQEAAAAAEHILRVRLEPRIEQALRGAGFEPTSIVERVALEKMVHELADEVADRGFITLGSLRDTVSRNQLKMTDLSSWNEFVSGDPLLRADRDMSMSLAGVYPRGPFYLRLLQKISSLAYGLHWGRLFTRYVAIPFGLAFLILKTIDAAIEHLPFIPKPHAAQHSVANPVANAEHAINQIEETHRLTPAAHHHVDVVYSHNTMFLLGLIIFSLIHFPHFRRSVISFLTAAWTILRVALIDIPRAVMRWRVVELLLKSFPMMLFRRFMLAPIFSTVIFWKVLPALGIYSTMNSWWGAAIFLASFLVLNSRIGRDTEELAREFFARTWYRIRVHLLMGLLTLIIDIFRAMMDGLERLLYAVDEFLRFRSGESNFTLGIKAVFGLVWSLIHGIIRFCVTLLIEPQVNPIKHFPVVTVSHKLLITTLPVPLMAVLKQFFDKPTAALITFLIVTSIPGVFGFLAWELKENWKLYKANRSPRLKPVSIGDHGETLLRLLCPGFHSGTIPRLFAKLRRAARRDRGVTTVNRQAKFQARLHHEGTAITHFFEREFLALLKLSRTFRNAPLRVQNVDLTTNRILVTFEHGSFPNEPMKIEFTEQSGWLAASTKEVGWLRQIEPDEADIVKAAITGIYKLSAVDLVHEQIQVQIASNDGARTEPKDNGSAPKSHRYDIGPQGLIIWPNGSYETEIYYPLDEQPMTSPRPRSLARANQLHPRTLNSLVFQLHEVTWEQWQRFWDNEQNIPAHSIARFPFRW